MTDLIPAPVRAEIREEHIVSADFLAGVALLEIASQEDLDFVCKLLVEVKERHKAFEEKRTRITKPILAAKRETDELFAPVLSPLKTAETLLKDKIAAYHVARNAERERLLPAVAAGEVPPDALAPVEHTKGVSVREVWAWEVVDEDAVPREWLVVDSLGLDKACVQRVAPPDIPGIRFFKRGTVAVRGARG